MNEYEKASILFQGTMCEYLHFIAWANDNGDGRIAKAAERLGTALTAECPSVAALIARAGKQ